MIDFICLELPWQYIVMTTNNLSIIIISLNSGCGLPDFSNDQQCDDENNNEECNFDGGACCNNNIAGWDKFCTDCECLQVTKLRLWSFMLYT